MKRLLALLAVLGLLLAACGDDDDTTAADDPTVDAEAGDDALTDDDTEREPVDADEDDYVAALASDLKDGESFPGTDEQIDCLAGGFVSALGGGEELAEAGITPEELAAAESPDALGLDIDVDAVAQELVDTFEACDYDLIGLLAETLGPEAPEGFEDCVRAEVSNEELAEVFARAIADPESQDAISGIVPILEGCAAPETETEPAG